MPKLLQEKIVKIDRLSPKGRGMVPDSSLEVIGALPDEEVRVEPGPRRKKKRVAFLREVLSASPERVKPRCVHVPQCGGCAFQQLDYGAQLEEKERVVVQQFASLIEAYKPIVGPIIGCKDPWRYRNKMEFSFSENKAGEQFLGLMMGGSRGRVLNLSECHLVSPWFSDVLRAMRLFWEKNSLRAYHHGSNMGHLRTLTLREAKKGEGKMAMLTVSGNPDFALKKEDLDRYVQTIKECTPDESVSIFVQIHQIAKGRPTEFFEMLLDGPDHITERLDVAFGGKSHTLDFKISPTSFFQPNTLQAERLYSEGLQMLSNLENARVFDLYCGGATLGLSAAKVAKEVVGIELNHHSVFDAGWNLEVNGIKNFSIVRGDVGKVLTELKKGADFIPPDVVIVDPPRAGLNEEALSHLIDFSPKEILYISCNPKTQVANIEELSKSGYQLKKLQPVDQFPHTAHIENIALLQKC